jgi:hypothetical protein
MLYGPTKYEENSNIYMREWSTLTLAYARIVRGHSKYVAHVTCGDSSYILPNLERIRPEIRERVTMRALAHADMNSMYPMQLEVSRSMFSPNLEINRSTTSEHLTIDSLTKFDTTYQPYARQTCGQYAQLDLLRA